MGTREAIRSAFMDAYSEDRLDRITVKALCAAVPIARTTFYAHYRNVDDVLVEVEDGLLSGLAAASAHVPGDGVSGADSSDYLDETFAFIKAHRADFKILLITQPDARFVEKWKGAISANLARRYPKAAMRPDWGLVAEMGASAIIGAYSFWLQHPERANLDNVKRLAECALSAIVVSA